MKKEKIQKLVIQLQEKHDELLSRIINADKNHGNVHIITVLKKEKLELKNEIEKLKNQLV